MNDELTLGMSMYNLYMHKMKNSVPLNRIYDLDEWAFCFKMLNQIIKTYGLRIVNSNRL